MEALVSLQQVYLDHHRGLGSSPKTTTHYENTFILFHRFLHNSDRQPDCTALTVPTFNAFAGWMREPPTKG